LTRKPFAGKFFPQLYSLNFTTKRGKVSTDDKKKNGVFLGFSVKEEKAV